MKHIKGAKSLQYGVFWAAECRGRNRGSKITFTAVCIIQLSPGHNFNRPLLQVQEAPTLGRAANPPPNHGQGQNDNLEVKDSSVVYNL